jgi:D-alanyl-D-alanine carboxypeptidase (penicillin-binding protein 5/6)
MRKIIFFLFCFALSLLQAESLKIRVSAKAAILMNADTGAILFEKNADMLMYPASITKIATSLYAVSQCQKRLEKIVSCPQHCLRKMSKSVKEVRCYQDPAYFLEPDGSHFWIKSGEKLRLRDLLYGMLLSSGNDAANSIAYHVGGSIPDFLKGMNAYLKQIGCKSTFFCNPHGLHHPRHVTTAHDMALITREALKYEAIREIVSSSEYERPETNLQGSRKVLQTNLLLRPGKFHYSKAIGMKTGHTSDAGFTFAGVAKEEGRTLIAILLQCESSSQRYRDAIRLFEKAFAEKKEKRLLFKREENVFVRKIKRAKNPLRATLFEDINISYFPSEEPDIKIELNWQQIALPIKKGIAVGEMRILDQNERTLEKVPLFAVCDVEKTFLAASIDSLLCSIQYRSFLKIFLFVLLLIGVFFTIFGVQKFGKT